MVYLGRHVAFDNDGQPVAALILVPSFPNSVDVIRFRSKPDTHHIRRRGIGRELKRFAGCVLYAIAVILVFVDAPIEFA